MADFNYFDQYMDMPIDLTAYLKSVPTTGESYKLSNIQPVVTTIKNLFVKYDLIYDYKANINVIFNYKIKDNQFVEGVSHAVYGDTQYWWLIYLFNNIKEPFKDWPLSQQQVVDIAKGLYEKERKYSYQTYLNFVFDHNEAKRDIILPNVDAIGDILWKYRQAILEG
jgi:hypothetical protein